MALPIIFNVAKGAQAGYGRLPLAADALGVMLLSAVEADTGLRDRATVAAILAAAGNTEATFTGYSRLTASGVTVSVDQTNDWVTVTLTNPTWTPTTVQTLAAIVIYYDDDTAAGTDANLIPIFADSFAVTTASGVAITYTVAAGGFTKAA